MVFGFYDIDADGANILDLVSCRFPKDLALLILYDMPYTYRKNDIVAHTTLDATMLELRVKVGTPETLRRQLSIWRDSFPHRMFQSCFHKVFGVLTERENNVRMWERCKAASIPFRYAREGHFDVMI